MLPVQITFRGVPFSSNLDALIRKKIEKLSQRYDRLSSCRVVIELPQRHKHQGRLFNMRIDLTVPGRELVSTYKHHEDIYIALRNAFNAIKRQLENLSHKRHGRVKNHHELLHGFVDRLFVKDGYGFIRGMDGNEYYFSLTNVSFPQFMQLTVGDAVEYLPLVSSDGWQANHIVREKNHHSYY